MVRYHLPLKREGSSLNKWRRTMTKKILLTLSFVAPLALFPGESKANECTSKCLSHILKGNEESLAQQATTQDITNAVQRFDNCIQAVKAGDKEEESNCASNTLFELGVTTKLAAEDFKQCVRACKQ